MHTLVCFEISAPWRRREEVFGFGRRRRCRGGNAQQNGPLRKRHLRRRASSSATATHAELWKSRRSRGHCIVGHGWAEVDVPRN